MVGFYRKLIPNFAELTLPLMKKMITATKGSIVLTKKEIQTFNNIINILNEFPLLAHTQPLVYQLDIDSSKYTLGAALPQVINGNPIPVEVFSK